MKTNKKNIDLDVLPAKAKTEIFNFYEFILKKYRVEKGTKVDKKNKNVYTDKELIEMFDWDPLLGEEWDGFHLASELPLNDKK